MRLCPVVLFGVAAMIAGCSRAPEKVVKDGMALAEADRVFIANIESRGLVLNRRGFPALVTAIRSGDSIKVAAFFAPEFSGEMFDEAKGAGVQAPTLTVHRRTMSDEGRKMVPARAAEFAQMLANLRGRFDSETEVDMALTNLSPRDRGALDGAWSAACVLRMAGKLADGRTGELMAKLELDLKSVPDADAITTAGGWIQSARLAEEQFAATTAPLMGEIGGERGINRWRKWGRCAFSDKPTC